MRRTRPNDEPGLPSADRSPALEAQALAGEGGELTPPRPAGPLPSRSPRLARLAGALGVLLVAATLLLSVLAVRSAGQAAALRDRGVPAEAQVVAVGGGWRWSADVRFALPSGEVRTATIGRGGWASRPQPETTVEVRYDPRDPSGTIVEARRIPGFVEAAWTAIGALACAVAAGAAFSGRLVPRRRPSA